MWRRRHPLLCELIQSAALCVGLLVGSLAARSAHADLFLLENGGRLEGEWVNHQEATRHGYVVRLASGGIVRLDADQVREAVRQRPVERQYDEIAPTYGDSVEAQWQLAEWCREQQLPAQRERHLRRVVQLDPQFHRAWMALGYIQVEGKWQLPVDAAREKGYERDRGRWRLPQEIALRDEREQLKRAELDWQRRIERLKYQMQHAERPLEAQREFLEIRDPNAVKPLGLCLLRDPRPVMRVMAAETLAGIGSPAAIQLLVQSSLMEPHIEAFHDIADRIVEKRFAGLSLIYIKALRHENNQVVNRAGHMLGRLGDATALEPLIDALVTTHYRTPPQSSHPDATTASFAKDGESSNPLGGGTGITKAGATAPIPITVPNQEVLHALVRLSRGVTFQFDQRAWRVWFAARRQGQAPQVDARRDN